MLSWNVANLQANPLSRLSSKNHATDQQIYNIIPGDSLATSALWKTVIQGLTVPTENFCKLIERSIFSSSGVWVCFNPIDEQVLSRGEGKL